MSHSTRERILDALEDVLDKDGIGGATLEAVAQQAGVSKGGLLYHFASKEALLEGFLERLATLSAQDAAQLTGPAGQVVRHHLEGSTDASDKISRTMVLALAVLGSNDIDARRAISGALEAWREPLHQAAGDAVLGRLIELVGDGLYLRAMLGRSADDLDRQVIERLVRHTEAP